MSHPFRGEGNLQDRNEVMGDMTGVGGEEWSSDTPGLHESSIDFGQTSEESMRRIRNMQQERASINPYVRSDEQQPSSTGVSSSEGAAVSSTGSPVSNTLTLTEVELSSIPAKNEHNTRSLYFLSKTENRIPHGAKGNPKDIDESIVEDPNTAADALPAAASNEEDPQPTRNSFHHRTIEEIRSLPNLDPDLEQEEDPNQYSRLSKNRIPGVVQPGAYDATPGSEPSRIRSIRTSEIMMDLSNADERNRAITTTGRENSTTVANNIVSYSNQPQPPEVESCTRELAEARKIQSQAELLEEARSIRPEREEAKLRKRRIALFVPLGVLVVLAIGVVLIVLWSLGLFTGNKKDQQQPAPTSAAPSTSPSEAPTAFILPLPDYTIAAIERDPTSPQSRAYRWLQEDHKLESYNDNQMQQRYALATFYYSVGGPDWILNDRWLSYERNGDECDWLSKRQGGSVCDASGNYIALVLTKNGLSGSLPPELSLLSHLEIMDVATNSIGGRIPTQIGLLTSLKELILDVNELGGHVPSEVGHLSELELFFVHTNPLTGSLPTQLGLVTNMIDLEVASTSIGGMIPSELGLCSKMSFLYLEDNLLVGSIPSELFLSKLDYLDLHNNQFHGSLPSQFGHLDELSYLDLDNNSLSGTLPTQMGMMTNMAWMFVSRNALNQMLPSQLGLLTGLSELQLHNNNFSGSIPSQFGRLHKLTTLDLDNNSLSGMLPTEVGMMTSMVWIFVSGNALNQMLPSQLGLLTHLSELLLHSNHFNFNLPSQLGLLKHLTYLDLDNNSLSSTIPVELFQNLQSISHLYLGGNDLNGTVPSHVGSLTSLVDLRLGDTLISGQIPSEMIALGDSLQVLDLNNTLITGVVPLELCDIFELNFSCSAVFCGCSCDCDNTGTPAEATMGNRSQH